MACPLPQSQAIHPHKQSDGHHHNRLIPAYNNSIWLIPTTTFYDRATRASDSARRKSSRAQAPTSLCSAHDSDIFVERIREKCFMCHVRTILTRVVQQTCSQHDARVTLPSSSLQALPTPQVAFSDPDSICIPGISQHHVPSPSSILTPADVVQTHRRVCL
ncbi:hypothetical protein P692DRAFT_20826098 [Suillus brevipes Sb2]|nr:hypothetical protein P692DRAFT_20826098 [Suillus brevipes Sb2]